MNRPKNEREVQALFHVMLSPALSLEDVADILDKVGNTIWISLLQTGDPGHFDSVELTDA